MIAPLNMTGRIAQLLCAGLMIAASQRHPHGPGKVDLKVSLLGERERPDGSWEGSDLLAAHGAHPSRFQLTVQPERDVRVALFARLPDGTRQQLFPAPGKSGVLGHGQSYALPGPHAFFELEGSVALELYGAPMHGDATKDRSVPRQAQREDQASLPLSDGARVDVRQVQLTADGDMLFTTALSSR
jgi:hypothetical protein